MRLRTSPRYRIALIALGLIATFFIASSSVGSLPAACSSCHAMKPFARQLKRSAHADVKCYSCHLANGGWDWPQFKLTEVGRMYPRAIVGGTVAGSVTPTGARSCIRCHEDVLMGTISSDGLRINHGVCASSGSCDNCHSTTAHGTAVRSPREPVMEDCTSCHARESAPTECNVCHEGKLETERLAAGPWQITHGPSWQTTHGMGNITSCSTCHPVDYCVRCHQVSLPHPVDFPSRHGSDAVAAPESCASCHSRERLCDTCHGIEMPHPAGFLREHSAIATSFTDEQCMKCHYESDCRRCHETHVHPGASDGTINSPLPKLGGGR